MLLKGMIEGEGVAKYFLSFRNAILRSGKIEEIKAAIAKIFKEGEDVLGRYLENAVKEVLGEGILGGKILTSEEIEVWAKKMFDEFGTKLRKIESFDESGVKANFDPNTNTINYLEGVTEYFMAHEYYHPIDLQRLGFDEFVKGGALKGTKYPDAFTASNFVAMYRREKFVADEMIKNSEKHGLNGREINHVKQYLGEIVHDMTAAGVKIPK